MYTTGISLHKWKYGVLLYGEVSQNGNVGTQPYYKEK